MKKRMSRKKREVLLDVARASPGAPVGYCMPPAPPVCEKSRLCEPCIHIPPPTATSNPSAPGDE